MVNEKLLQKFSIDFVSEKSLKDSIKLSLQNDSRRYGNLFRFEQFSILDKNTVDLSSNYANPEQLAKNNNFEIENKKLR